MPLKCMCIICDANSAVDFIRTVHGIGYTLGEK
ncbi:Uncharacterised protein [Escherichia coli]|uniref:Uncharacterized protein n=1 Tax=Escherichia coli TaxID=562 RepID=A0A376VX23_ECOLX|nr:Uncharacterised protein [Escherichia coli]